MINKVIKISDRIDKFCFSAQAIGTPIFLKNSADNSYDHDKKYDLLWNHIPQMYLYLIKKQFDKK